LSRTAAVLGWVSQDRDNRYGSVGCSSVPRCDNNTGR